MSNLIVVFMKLTRVLVGWAVGMSSIARSADTVNYNLPDGVKVIESARIVDSKVKNRMLILWMKSPQTNPRNNPNDVYSCPEETLGHYYSGPTRISLVDTKKNKIINTIRVISADSTVDSFNIPYKIKPTYYFVQKVDDKGEGAPTLLHLSDVNGDGLKNEFVLYEAIACMGLNTTLIGYDEHSDRVVNYQIRLKITSGSVVRNRTTLWLDYLFSKVRSSVHVWKYEIDYRGRGGCLDKYTVKYDVSKRCFIGELNQSDCQ